MANIIKHQRKTHIIAEVTITVWLSFYAVSSGTRCPDQNLCQCKFYTEEVDLDCIGTGDLVELKRCLKENFQNFTIRTMFVRQCNATSLPEKFVQNITVNSVYMRCPLLNFSDEAFVDSLLFQFRLYNHRLTAIPDAFTSTVQLRRLSISNGTLETIGDQLKGLSSLSVLSLRMNRIRYVTPDAFASLISLREIYLSYNQIKNMEPTSFSSCKDIKIFYLDNNYLESAEGLLDFMSPTVINLQNNNLTDIHIFHPGMRETNELRIGGNPVGHLDTSIFGRYMINVLNLDLSNMSLSNVSGTLSTAFPYLITLDLSFNQLQNIRSEIFYNLIEMAELDLSHNKLTSIKGVFQNRTAISKLDISSNRIVDLEDSLNEMPNLRELIIARNNIWALTDENFRNTSILGVLYAEKNNISTLTKDCFRHTKHLVDIRLSLNNLVSLNGSIKDLPNLRKVYLVLNRIQALEDDDFANVPKLSVINLMNNHLTSLNGQFKYLYNLQYLNLQHNRLSTLGIDTFPVVVTIGAFLLDGNPLSCDCRLEWLSLLTKKYKVLKDKPICEAPYWLKGRYFRTVTRSELVDWKESCPPVCKCHCLPNGSELGIAVDCSRGNLKEVPGKFPREMTQLNLSNNNISVIRKPALNGTFFGNLQELDIENNRVTVVDGLRSFRHLSILKLANNSLEKIAVGGSYNYNLVTLSGNPWLCDCSTVWFRNWMLCMKNKIPDLNRTMCAKGNVKDELCNTPLIYLSESDICPQKTILYIFVPIGVLAFLLLVILASFTYFRYRLNIKVWLYAHGFSWVKEEDTDEDKSFDAFVSFGNGDEEFVYGTLISELENDTYGYRLCTTDRNFPPGQPIMESVLSAVRSSKRTIVVLSKNYLKCESSIMEFKFALMEALKDKTNHVVVVGYGELPPMKEIHKVLPVYLTRSIYLTWGEKYFWKKLRYAFPKVAKERALEDHHGDSSNLLDGL